MFLSALLFMCGCESAERQQQAVNEASEITETFLQSFNQPNWTPASVQAMVSLMTETEAKRFMAKETASMTPLELTNLQRQWWKLKNPIYYEFSKSVLVFFSDADKKNDYRDLKSAAVKVSQRYRGVGVGGDTRQNSFYWSTQNLTLGLSRSEKEQWRIETLESTEEIHSYAGQFLIWWLAQFVVPLIGAMAFLVTSLFFGNMSGLGWVGILGGLTCWALLAALGVAWEYIIGIGFIAWIVVRLLMSKRPLAIVAGHVSALLISGAVAYIIFDSFWYGGMATMITLFAGLCFYFGPRRGMIAVILCAPLISCLIPVQSEGSFIAGAIVAATASAIILFINLLTGRKRLKEPPIYMSPPPSLELLERKPPPDSWLFPP